MRLLATTAEFFEPGNEAKVKLVGPAGVTFSVAELPLQERRRGLKDPWPKSKF